VDRPDRAIGINTMERAMTRPSRIMTEFGIMWRCLRRLPAGVARSILSEDFTVVSSDIVNASLVS